MAHNSQIHFIS